MFEGLFSLATCPLTGHMYTLCLEGVNKKISETFATREAANKRMFKLCGKYNLRIVEVYDDHHYKTYKCSDGATFYINRV